MTGSPSFTARSLRALLIGLPGLLALPFLVDAPAGIPAAALVVGPAVLMFAAALTGAWAASRTGVRSWLILGSEFKANDILLGAVAGALTGFAVAFTDHAATPLWRGAAMLPLSVIEAFSLRSNILGILYGGLTEEVIFRWGLSSGLAAIAMLMLPRRLAIVTAVTVAAALFAIAHLPAAFAGVADWQVGAVVRTIGWNALLGLMFGMFFFYRSFEAAVSAHICFHFGTASAAAF